MTTPKNDQTPESARSLTHLDEQGRVKMVDVGWKPTTTREAIARGYVSMQPETLRLIKEGLMKKGDVLTVAQLAGIMGAKRTSELIPLCHPLPLNKVDVALELDEEQSRVNITVTARTSAKTGVEMEALTAVSVAALTVYDMCKAVDRGTRIEGIRLVRKWGGQSGDIVLEELDPPFEADLDLVEIPTDYRKRQEPIIKGKGTPVRALVSDYINGGSTPEEVSQHWGGYVTPDEVRAAIAYWRKYPESVEDKLSE